MNPDKTVITRALQVGAIDVVMARGVEERHFADPEARQVWSWASDHARQYGATPSQTLLHERFPDWMGEPTSDPLEAVVDIFLRAVKRRAFIEEVRTLAPLADDPSSQDHLDELMHEAARRMAEVVPSSRVTSLRDAPDRVAEYELEKVKGVQAGILMGVPQIDTLTMGMQKGDIIVLAGYLGTGKSLSASWFLSNAHAQDANGLLLSLEMSARAIMRRFDTMRGQFEYLALKRRELPQADLDRYKKIARDLAAAQADVKVLDRLGACTVDRVYAEINRYKPDVACIDYVQRMRGHKSLATWERVKLISNELKDVAMATDTPIIVVAQSNRSSKDQGADTDSIGDSIALSQDADIFLGLQADEEMRQQKKLRISMKKNRDGPPIGADLYWDPSRMKFGPWSDFESNVFMRKQPAAEGPAAEINDSRQGSGT